MKKTLAAILTLWLVFAAAASDSTVFASGSVPPTKIDIYPVEWTGNPIPNKVFTISPALPNGATSVTGGATFARIFVASSCSTNPNSAPCMNKNVWYTINGGACFNRLRIRFGSAYSWQTEPNIIFSQLYDGNEGFQVSGGSNYSYSLLPRTSPYPCG